MQTKSAGFYVSTYKFDKYVIPNKKRIRDKKYYQYDLDGNFIQEFGNFKAIREYFNHPCPSFHDEVLYRGVFKGYQ